jgi:hypothetical protein
MEMIHMCCSVAPVVRVLVSTCWSPVLVTERGKPGDDLAQVRVGAELQDGERRALRADDVGLPLRIRGRDAEVAAQHLVVLRERVGERGHAGRRVVAERGPIRVQHGCRVLRDHGQRVAEPAAAGMAGTAPGDGESGEHRGGDQDTTECLV